MFLCVCCSRIRVATCNAFTFINIHLSEAVPLIYLVKVYQPTRTDMFASLSAFCMAKGSCDKLRKNEAADKLVLCVPCPSSLLHKQLQSCICLRPSECGCLYAWHKAAPCEVGVKPFLPSPAVRAHLTARLPCHSQYSFPGAFASALLPASYMCCTQLQWLLTARPWLSAQLRLQLGSVTCTQLLTFLMRPARSRGSTCGERTCTAGPARRLVLRKKQVKGKVRIAGSHFSYLGAAPGRGQWAAALRLDPAVIWQCHGSSCSRGMFVFGKRILFVLLITCLASI